MAAKHAATIDTPHGPRKCLQVSRERGEGRKPLVARFGGIPLKRQRNAVLTDRSVPPVIIRRTELISRLLAGRCEVCKDKGGVQVHHVRKLADLDTREPKPVWVEIMAKMRRKTLMVCQACHDTIHNRKPTATPTE
jgi:hypothetical protein